MPDDLVLWLPVLIFVFVVAGFHFWMRAIARREIRKELKGWVLAKSIQPRNSKGQFRKNK